MARISLSEILQNIAGSVGEHTYACWKGVNYLRQKAVTISNPCSILQALTRVTLSGLAKAWHTLLTDAQRAAWNEYASSLKSAGEQVGPNGNGGAGCLQVIPDNGGVMSGFNAYVMLNFNAHSINFYAPTGTAFLAPLGIDAPNAPTGLTCGYCFDDPNSLIGLEWTDPIDAPEDSKIRIWLLSLDSGVHRQLVWFVDLAVEVFGIVSVRIAQGALVPVSSLPGHYLVQIDCVSPRGQKSPPSNVCQTTVTVAVPPACGFVIP